jgi:hypothetical protein
MEENYPDEFIDRVYEVTKTVITPLQSNENADYAKFVNTYPDTEFDCLYFCNEKPSRMNYTFLIDDEEVQIKYHKI